MTKQATRGNDSAIRTVNSCKYSTGQHKSKKQAGVTCDPGELSTSSQSSQRDLKRWRLQERKAAGNQHWLLDLLIRNYLSNQ